MQEHVYGSSGASVSSASRGAKTIMVVDDDRDIREALDQILADEGYHVRVAENGLRLVSAIELDRPALILLDVMMSWLDGFELCRSLKRNERFRDIPVAFLSAKTRVEDVRHGLECGAVAYFTKPVDASVLLDRIQAIVSGDAAPLC
jgi:DNA-binding response OmpR family regulator